MKNHVEQELCEIAAHIESGEMSADEAVTEAFAVGLNHALSEANKAFDLRTESIRLWDDFERSNRALPPEEQRD